MLHENAAPVLPVSPEASSLGTGHAHTCPSQKDVQRNRQTMNQQVLLKLLRLEPDTYENLVSATGWSHEATHTALLQLIASGAVQCIKRNGRRFFSVKEN